jgi:hypothetical protein
VAALAEVQLEKRPSAGHMTRVRNELAPQRSRAHPSAHLAPQAETGVSPSSHPNTVVVTFHLSTFDEAATLTATELRRKAEAVKERLAEVGAKDIKTVTGKPFLPRCQDMPEEAFLKPKDAAALYAKRRRGIKVVSYGWRSPGVPDPDGCALAKIRAALKSNQPPEKASADELKSKKSKKSKVSSWISPACRRPFHRRRGTPRGRSRCALAPR